MSMLPNILLTRLDGRTESLQDYNGKVLLIVNVASQCGFTPQYAELQALYDEVKDAGFEILGFPCNQFGAQEPGERRPAAQAVIHGLGRGRPTGHLPSVFCEPEV